MNESHSVITILKRSLQPVSAPRPPEESTAKAAKEMNPFIMIFLASIVAFHVAVVTTGVMAAWVYFWRNTGAFAP